MSFVNRGSKRTRFAVSVIALLLLATAISGCGGAIPDPSTIPLLDQIFAPPTATATPTSPPTATPLPTPTPKAGETPLPPTATPVPTPQVTIPKGFTVVKDDRLGYSFAIPRGWSELDLRGAQFRQLLTTVGQGAVVPQIDSFLATKEGEMLGKIYIADLLNAMSGGLPSAIVVPVVPAPAGMTLEDGKAMVEANLGALPGAKAEGLEIATINGIPGIRGNLTANLASVGFNATAFGKVVALLANDKLYIMGLVTQESNRGAKEPIFDQVIGTFRPE